MANIPKPGELLHVKSLQVAALFFRPTSLSRCLGLLRGGEVVIVTSHLITEDFYGDGRLNITTNREWVEVLSHAGVGFIHTDMLGRFPE